MDVAAYFVTRRAATLAARNEGTDNLGIEWGGPVMRGRESVELARLRNRAQAEREASGAIPQTLLATLERRPELRLAVVAAVEEDEHGTR
jgi:hypothetical protein